MTRKTGIKAVIATKILIKNAYSKWNKLIPIKQSRPKIQASSNCPPKKLLKQSRINFKTSISKSFNEFKASTTLTDNLLKYNVGAINFGLTAGKCNFHYPWNKVDKDGNTILWENEPEVWFHDIYRLDGTPWNTEEVEFIRQMTGVSKNN